MVSALKAFSPGWAGNPINFLEIALFQIAFQGIEAGNAQHGGKEEAAGYVEGGDAGVTTAVAQRLQQPRQIKDFPCIAQELVEFALGAEQPFGLGLDALLAA